MLKYFFVALVIPAFAFADNFDTGKSGFSNIRAAYESAIQPIIDAANATIAGLNKGRENKLGEKAACTTFECAQILNDEIVKIDSEILRQEDRLRVNVIAIEDTYEFQAKGLAIETILAELVELVKNDSRFSNITIGTTKCLVSSNGLGVSGKSQCSQLNVDFKFANGLFYRTEKVFGLQMRFRDGNGVLSYKKKDFPIALKDVEILFADRSVLFYGVTADLLLRNDSYDAYVWGDDPSKVVLGGPYGLGWMSFGFQKL